TREVIHENRACRNAVRAPVVHRRSPLVAHHSVRATFDDSKMVKITGVVTRIDWTNPDVVFYLNVKDNVDAASSWTLEMSAPHSLAASGVEKDFFKVGDAVSADIWVAKNGSQYGNTRTLTLSSGQSFDVGDKFEWKKITLKK